MLAKILSKENIRKAYFRVRFLFYSLGTPFYLKKLLSNPHTHVYIAIFLAIFLSYINSLSFIAYFILVLACISMFCGILYLSDRVLQLKRILSMEQAKLMLKDQIIRETLFHKKELQYKLDKLKDTPKHDLPLTSRGKTVLRKKVSGNLIDVKKFVKRTKNDNE